MHALNFIGIKYNAMHDKSIELYTFNSDLFVI